jgi:hypothetical protein
MPPGCAIEVSRSVAVLKPMAIKDRAEEVAASVYVPNRTRQSFATPATL